LWTFSRNIHVVAPICFERAIDNGDVDVPSPESESRKKREAICFRRLYGRLYVAGIRVVPYQSNKTSTPFSHAKISEI
jgi:hypothetical protein